MRSGSRLRSWRIAYRRIRLTVLGSRFGSWLLERGLTPKYAHLGTYKEGCGGLWEQFPHQGIDPAGIMAKTKELLKG